MNTRSSGQEPTTPYSEPERFIHQAKKKKERRNPFIPVEDRASKVKCLPFENLFEALIVYNPFFDFPFPMADDQPMWGNNRAVAPAPGVAIIAVDLGENFTVKGSNDSKLMEKIEALTTKIDSQFKDIKGEMKEMRYGCNSYGGPHPSSECDDKPMGGPKDEEANYAYGGYRGGGYQGNYYGRSSGTCRDRQPRDKNRNSQPQKDTPSVPPTPKKKFDESDFEKTMREFMSGLTYDPSVNPNAKTIVIHDDSEDEANEAEKEAESIPSKQTK
ncbi:hypothetical protein Tco_0530292 [Tanacetum coccineum]